MEKPGGGVIRWAATWSVSWCFILGEGQAWAQNRGVYPLGMSATNSGVTPQAGFTYSNQLLFYSRDKAKDNDGITLPVTGNNAVIMDMNTIAWASDMEILGNARYSAAATLPFARNNLTSDVSGRISGGGGFADSYYMPLILGWSWDRLSIRAIYGFLAPTGRFSTDADDNVGSGYWTHAFSSGQTWRLSKSGRLVLSTFQMYEFHTTQEGTGIRPGQTFNLDYSLMVSVQEQPRSRIQVGVAGYEQRQTTAKRSPGETASSQADRYAVNALGLAITGAFPRQRVSFALKAFKEFANRSTFEGYSVQLMGAISF